MAEICTDSWLGRLRKRFARGSGPSDPSSVEATATAPESDASPPRERIPEIAACLVAFDDGVRSAEKAWAGGVLMSKVNPKRVERMIEVLATRDSQAISAMVVEIGAPDTAVSPVTTKASLNNPLREKFARGVMGAVLTAIVEVELAYDSRVPTAAALLARVRQWVAEPSFQQVAGERTSSPMELTQANDVLCRIAGDILSSHKGSNEAAAIVRLGIVVPLSMALQIASSLEAAGRTAWDAAQPATTV